MFYIFASYHYYGSTSRPDGFVRKANGEIWQYACASDAQAWIQEEQEYPYILQNNEYAAPEYRVVENMSDGQEDCIPASADGMLGWVQVDPAHLPDGVKDELDAACVEFVISEGEYSIYAAYADREEDEYAIVFFPRAIALERCASDLGMLDWDKPAYLKYT